MAVLNISNGLSAVAGLWLIELSTPGQLDVDIVANMVRENPTLPLPRFVTQLLTKCGESMRLPFQNFLNANRLSPHIRVVASRVVM